MFDKREVKHKYITFIQFPSILPCFVMIRYSIFELSHIKLGSTNIFEFFKIMEIVQVKAFIYEVVRTLYVFAEKYK